MSYKCISLLILATDRSDMLAGSFIDYSTQFTYEGHAAIIKEKTALSFFFLSFSFF